MSCAEQRRAERVGWQPSRSETLEPAPCARLPDGVSAGRLWRGGPQRCAARRSGLSVLCVGIKTMLLETCTLSCPRPPFLPPSPPAHSPRPASSRAPSSATQSRAKQRRSRPKPRRGDERAGGPRAGPLKQAGGAALFPTPAGKKLVALVPAQKRPPQPRHSKTTDQTRPGRGAGAKEQVQKDRIVTTVGFEIVDAAKHWQVASPTPED